MAAAALRDPAQTVGVVPRMTSYLLSRVFL
uniref:Uncharacterized protein n=1 Tax=Rhinolophus ferrumequinum TaxID=59479 RepID=A0A671E8W5_RHIFE